jgi:hypothetical protein
MATVEARAAYHDGPSGPGARAMSDLGVVAGLAIVAGIVGVVAVVWRPAFG